VRFKTLSAPNGEIFAPVSTDRGHPKSTLSGSGRTGGGAAATAKKKKKVGRRRLEMSDPLKYQVYERIQRAHSPGDSYVDIVTRLQGDKDFAELVERAKEKLNTNLVKKALELFAQRRRGQAAKNQETLPA
jgi:hypothetical protein